MDKSKLKEFIKDLSQEEVEELKVLLNDNEEEPIENGTPDVDEASDFKEKDSLTEAEDGIKEEESTPTEETSNEKDSEIGEEETAEEPVEEEKPAEEEPVEEQEEVENFSEDDDDIPMMQKGIVEKVEDEEPTEPQNITAEDGEELPIDYEQIIDGLNAKLAAVEAENKLLKNKYEGAFGYSAKPTTPAKVNRLYDECEDVHFHR